MYISEKAVSRENSFDFLRFLAATMVIFGHSFSILGINNANFPYGYIAVSIFFLISGFLITASWLNSKTPFHYFKNRFLRLYPALTVVILISFFIIGPIFSEVPVKVYFTDPSTWKYLLNISIIKFESSLATVFQHNIYPETFNGSLWTLRSELHCYLIVAAAGLIGLFRNKILTALVIMIPLVIWGANISDSNELYFISIFFIGTLYFIFKDKIILNKYIFAGAIILFLLYLNMPSHIIVHNLLLLLSLPYIVFFTAYNLPAFNNFSKYGDFSYGLYIYAFPIQQIISYLTNGKIQVLVFFGVVFVLTLICAILSWHFVEKKALALKKIQFRETIKKAVKAAIS